MVTWLHVIASEEGGGKIISKKKKGKYGVKEHQPAQYQPVIRHRGRRKLSNSMKILSAFALILIVGGVAYWQLSPRSQPFVNQYPQTVAGIFYPNPTTAQAGTVSQLPYGFAEQNKLVFLDLKLQNSANEITYQGRSIPLGLYKGGEYLPVLVISTPSQKLVSGIRVCEPCGSFSFHIIEGKYLDCDKCHTRWDIETLQGLSGGCPNYPPPRLESLVSGSNVEIDLSPLGINVIA